VNLRKNRKGDLAMNIKHVSTLLVLSIFLSVLVACGGSMSQVETRVDQVDAVASKIADFNLPAGYHAAFSSNLMGYSLMAYSRGVGPSHIYLIQSEKQSVGEKLACSCQYYTSQRL
jgi:hypothetical protein